MMSGYLIFLLLSLGEDDRHDQILEVSQRHEKTVRGRPDHKTSLYTCQGRKPITLDVISALNLSPAPRIGDLLLHWCAEPEPLNKDLQIFLYAGSEDKPGWCQVQLGQVHSALSTHCLHVSLETGIPG